MWYTLNLLLWILMFGAVFWRVDRAEAMWIAAIGLVAGAFWEHTMIRGFLRPRK